MAKNSEPPQAVFARPNNNPEANERPTRLLNLRSGSNIVRKKYAPHNARKSANGSDLNQPKFPL